MGGPERRRWQKLAERVRQAWGPLGGGMWDSQAATKRVRTLSRSAVERDAGERSMNAFGSSPSPRYASSQRLPIAFCSPCSARCSSGTRRGHGGARGRRRPWGACGPRGHLQQRRRRTISGSPTPGGQVPEPRHGTLWVPRRPVGHVGREDATSRAAARGGGGRGAGGGAGGGA